MKGRTQEQAEALLRDARVERAGAFSVVLEIVAPETAKMISQAIQIPTIGIGSGKDCDGQILVTHDLIGLFLVHAEICRARGERGRADSGRRRGLLLPALETVDKARTLPVR